DGVADAALVIDFSSNTGTKRALAIAAECGAALLVGTTALADDTRAAIDAHARHHPALVASNTSRGVAILTHLVRETAARIFLNHPPESAVDIDIVETHHAAKADRPSGTALRLAAA